MVSKTASEASGGPLKPLSEGPHTQAVETEGAVVEEEADVACSCRHAVEGVGAAGRQRVNAAGEQENEQRPGEGVLPGCLDQHHCHQLPQEIPAGGESCRMRSFSNAESVNACFCIYHFHVNLSLMGCFYSVWRDAGMLRDG